MPQPQSPHFKRKNRKYAIFQCGGYTQGRCSSHQLLVKDVEKVVLEQIKNDFIKKVDIDISKTNTITISDFLTTCKSFAVFPSINEIKVLYKRYAVSLFDQLNYVEFIKMISPIKSQYTKIIENRNVIKLEMNDYSLMLFETKTLIKDMLNHFLYCETFLEQYRKELNTKNEFSCIEAWAILMRYSQSGEYITKEEFKQFLDDKSCLITKFELDCLINKFDWDKDGVVNYSDFAKEILTYGK